MELIEQKTDTKWRIEEEEEKFMMSPQVPRFVVVEKVADAQGRPVLRPAGNTTPTAKASEATVTLKQQKPKSPLVSKHNPCDSPQQDKQNPHGHKPAVLSSGVKPGKTLVKGGACKSPRSPVAKSPKSPIVGNSPLKSSATSFNFSCSSQGGSTDSPSCNPKKAASPPQRKLSMLSPSSSSSGSFLSYYPHDPQVKNTCTWITPKTDPLYAAFHDEEWGVPVHDDKMLFELLVLCGALAELNWPAILNARDTFREAFAAFDPAVVAGFDDIKIASLMSTKNIMLHEGKLRGIVNNAKLILQIVEQFGSLDKYIWGFVGYKSIINRYRYPRQVPVKTPKAEYISKDLQKRGFRSVGPIVIYSFMQVAGMTNDHQTYCFRWKQCVLLSEGQQAETGECNKIQVEDVIAKGREGIVVKSFEKANLINFQK